MNHVTFENIPEINCIVSKKNQRDYMEDRHIVAQINSKKHGIIDILAVFDGHGGNTISQVLVNYFPKKLMQAIESIDFLYSMNIVTILNKLIIDIDEQLYKCHAISGSTAVIAIIVRKIDTLFISNLGDSRSIIWYKNKLILNTIDHKPTNLNEMKRIQKSNGQVSMKRVAGILAVSRAFGDFTEGLKLVNGVYKGPNAPVSSKPDIYILDLKKFRPAKLDILLASDGLWDVFTNHEIINLYTNSSIKCIDIINLAVSKGSTDNITVLKAKI